MKYQEPENELLRRRRRDKNEFLSSTIGGDKNSSSNSYMMTVQPSSVPIPNAVYRGSGGGVGGVGGHNYVHSSSSGGNATVVASPNKGRSSSIDSLHSTGSSSGPPQSPESPTRRLSTPYVLHGSGILSATLQLPVKIMQHEASSGGGGGGGCLNLAADLPDIPYIEDSNYCTEVTIGKLISLN